MRAALALAFALVAAPPALAQTGTATFSADGLSFTVAVPKGYCTEGPGIAAYLERQRAGKPDLVPEVVMMPCGWKDADPVDMIAIAWRPSFGTANTSEDLLGEMRRTFPSQGAAGATVTAKELEQRLTAQVAAGPGLTPLGVDDVCAYVGGTLGFEEKMPAVALGCLTVVEGLVFTVSCYRAGTGPDSIAATLPVVPVMGRAIRLASQ